jgi:hypothetical protein
LAEKVHELTFVADVAGWINNILSIRPELPFKEAKIEKSAQGKRTRRDLTLFDRDGNKALTGEVKMPDAPDGLSPFDNDVVQDAFQKASDAGARYFFTWNVNRFVLWDPSKVTLPTLQRQSKDYTLFKLRTSGEVESPFVVDKLKNEFLPNLLNDLAALYRGETPFGVLPPDQRFVLMLETFLDRPVELARFEIYRLWKTRPAFQKELRDWMVTRQRWTIPKEESDVAQLLDRAAKLCCYVLATKLIFYEALRARFDELKPISVSPSVDSADRLYGLLSKHFENAQHVTHDYETIFWPDFGAKVPMLATGAVDAWKRIIEQINLFNLRRLGLDVLGPIFKRLIDKDEKHKYGQYYTDPVIVDVINAFTIRTSDAVILDPGCGSGTFLVRAYARKRWLDAKREHPSVLAEVYGVDWSGLAVHLSALSLASQDLVVADNYPRITRADFFDVALGHRFMTLPKGNKQTEIKSPRIDAGIGNPPYIRQEEISKARKKFYQNLARREAPDLDFSGRSDIYVYFWPHMMSLLSPDGYLGLLTSSSWLDVDYGFRLQRWFLSNFRILAIIESMDEIWFEDARVLTSVTIVQPCKDETERMDNKVRFVQLRAPVARLLENDGTEDGRQQAAERFRDRILATDEEVSNEQLRVLIRTQRQLWDEGCRLSGVVNETEKAEDESEEDQKVESMHEWRKGSTYLGNKWGRYLRAPDFFFELMHEYGQSFVPLVELANVTYGVKSGCDDFFFPTDYTQKALEDKPDARSFKNEHGVSRARVQSGKVKIIKAGDGTLWPVEERFLEPEVHSLMKINSVAVRSADLDRLILLVGKPQPKLKGTLVIKYIQYGEKETFGGDTRVPERPTCKSRNLWYDVTGNTRGDVLWSMTHKYRHIAPSNPELLICNHRLFAVRAKDKRFGSAVAALLNSTLVAFFKHYYGRYAGMEHTLDTEVIDVDMLPVPDLRKGTTKQIQALESAFAKMAGRQIDSFLEDAFLEMIPLNKLDSMKSAAPTLPRELKHSDRQELDKAVLRLIGVPEAEVRNVFDRLYAETTLLYRRGRIQDIKTAANKRRVKKGASATPKEIAESVLESLPAGIFKRYPKDFIIDSEPSDSYVLPDGNGRIVEDMFHRPRLKFKQDEVEFRHREQAALALALHSTGVRQAGQWTLTLPATPERCREIQEQWSQYVRDLKVMLESEVAQRTPDEKKADAAVSILLRRAVEAEGNNETAGGAGF